MSNSGKGSGKLPARANNPKRVANRAASYKRGQVRKDERRLAQSKRERANKELALLSLPTRWEQATQGQSETRNRHYNVGTAQYVVSNPLTKLAKGQMNPGRSVSIRTMRDRKLVVFGWEFSCFNCNTNKKYLNEYFHDAEGSAISEGHTHMCAPQSWKSPYKASLV